MAYVLRTQYKEARLDSGSCFKSPEEKFLVLWSEVVAVIRIDHILAVY